MQLQENFGRRIFSVLLVPEEVPADLQNAAIVCGIDCAQHFWTSLQGLVQDIAKPRLLQQDRIRDGCHCFPFPVTAGTPPASLPSQLFRGPRKALRLIRLLGNQSLPGSAAKQRTWSLP